MERRSRQFTIFDLFVLATAICLALALRRIPTEDPTVPLLLACIPLLVLLLLVTRSRG